MVLPVTVVSSKESASPSCIAGFPVWEVKRIMVPNLVRSLRSFLEIHTIEWFGLEGPYRLSSSEPPALGRDTFH